MNSRALFEDRPTGAVKSNCKCNTMGGSGIVIFLETLLVNISVLRGLTHIWAGYIYGQRSRPPLFTPLLTFFRSSIAVTYPRP
jgi:hypothetical protein